MQAHNPSQGGPMPDWEQSGTHPSPSKTTSSCRSCGLVLLPDDAGFMQRNVRIRRQYGVLISSSTAPRPDDGSRSAAPAHQIPSRRIRTRSPARPCTGWDRCRGRWRWSAVMQLGSRYEISDPPLQLRERSAHVAGRRAERDAGAGQGPAGSSLRRGRAAGAPRRPFGAPDKRPLTAQIR